MVLGGNDFEELGLKVQRAQSALEQVRGVGTANGIRVVVDAENRLLSATDPDGDAVSDALVAAYNAAVDDVRPRVEEAMREVRSDPRVAAMSTFVEANSARQEAERAQLEEEDDDYYDEQFRRGWKDR